MSDVGAVCNADDERESVMARRIEGITRKLNATATNGSGVAIG